MTDWATPDDVDDLTGEQVTIPEIKRAQAIVELFAGTTTLASDAGNLSQTNLRHLRRATAYQTVWMREHPDVFTNVDVDGYSQDGQSASQAHANAALLAPLAKRCIDRLSWQQQPWRVRRRRRDRYPDEGTRDSPAHDDSLRWRPM